MKWREHSAGDDPWTSANELCPDCFATARLCGGYAHVLLLGALAEWSRNWVGTGSSLSYWIINDVKTGKRVAAAIMIQISLLWSRITTGCSALLDQQHHCYRRSRYDLSLTTYSQANSGHIEVIPCWDDSQATSGEEEKTMHPQKNMYECLNINMCRIYKQEASGWWEKRKGGKRHIYRVTRKGEEVQTDLVQTIMLLDGCIYSLNKCHVKVTWPLPRPKHRRVILQVIQAERTLLFRVLNFKQNSRREIYSSQPET